MKYVMVLLLTFVFYSAYPQKWKLGLRSGASFANFYDHNANDGSYKTDFLDDMKAGFFVDVFFDWRWSKKNSLEAGIGYCQKGIDLHYGRNTSMINTDNSTTTTSYHFRRDLRSNYITVPVVLHYALGKNERFYILAGSYHAAGIKYKIKDASIHIVRDIESATGEKMTAIAETHITGAAVRIFDSGLIGGVGIECPLSEKCSLGLETRVNLGLISLSGPDQVQFFNFSKEAKNINIEAGLKFRYAM